LKIATWTGDAPRPPLQTHPSLGGETGLPLPSPVDFLVEAGKGGDVAEVGGQPLAHLGRERLLLAGE
jgi:hypothetical protein